MQPAAQGLLSGGYLYNACMAQHGAWTLLDVAPADLSARVEHLQADLVLLDSLFLLPAYSAAVEALRRRRQPFGFVLHALPSGLVDHSPAASRGTSYERHALAASDVVVTLGPHYTELLREIHAVERRCPPGVRTCFRAAQPKSHRVGRWLSLGSLTPLKGFLDLTTVCDALDAQASLPTCWHVIGSDRVDPEYATLLRERAARHPALVLTGQLPPEAVGAHLLQADVLVSTSYRENHPLVVLEAMAAGVPVVGYEVGAMAEMLEPPARGLLVPPGAVHMLAHSLALLFADAERWLAMATAAYHFGSTLPSWAQAAASARQALCGAME